MMTCLLQPKASLDGLEEIEHPGNHADFTISLLGGLHEMIEHAISNDFGAVRN